VQLPLEYISPPSPVHVSCVVDALVVVDAALVVVLAPFVVLPPPPESEPDNVIPKVIPTATKISIIITIEAIAPPLRPFLLFLDTGTLYILLNDKILKKTLNI
jgi:hypothetical protein